MPFLDEVDEYQPDEPAIWIDCEECGETYNALDEGECPDCGDSGELVGEEE